MPKVRGNIIDLASSPPPEAGPSSAMTNKRTNPATESESKPDFSVPVPKVDQLASQFYTRDGLHRYLTSMSPATLSKMLLSQVQDHQFRPRPQIPPPRARTRQQHRFAHCVYCHKVYDKHQSKGCKVKHFGELKDASKYGDEKVWTCCSREVSYVNYDSDYNADPVDEEPYCYTGKHWDREIGDDDGQEGNWWKEWGDNGVPCANKGCDKGFERVVRTGMLNAKRAKR